MPENMYEMYREDLPELVRGRLDPARAGEILRAAEHDAELREAIEQERSLDRWLEYYEVPTPPQGFERRFWNRFHEDRVGPGRGAWLFKLVGPLAAGVLIAVGIILFVNKEDPAQPESETTAESDEPPSRGSRTLDYEIEWDASEFDYIAGAEAEDRAALDLKTLELLKALDDPAFLPLDNLKHPDDMAVIDDLELIIELAEDE